MTKKVTSAISAARRKPVAPQASSGARGRALDGVLAQYEALEPETVARSGLSSAGTRAGTIVRGMRRSAKLTQAALAERVGVSQERVSEIERGAGPQGPTFELLERIATACDMVLVPVERPHTAATEEAAEEAAPAMGADIADETDGASGV